jgi:DNA-binding response OmpR family regulator
MDAYAESFELVEPVGHRLLVVVPDARGRDRVGLQLAFAGYDVTPARRGLEALALLEQRRFDLIVVDLETPELDLLARRPRLAKDERPGILCLVDYAGLEELVPELGVAVEDYVTKPWHPAELVARVRVLLRDRSPGPGETLLRQGDLVLNEAVCDAWRNGRPLGLTPAEYRLLRQLLLQAGHVLSKEQLARQVWGEQRDHNTIERLVSRLRHKVDGPADPALIRTRRGFGYCLDIPLVSRT